RRDVAGIRRRGRDGRTADRVLAARARPGAPEPRARRVRRRRVRRAGAVDSRGVDGRDGARAGRGAHGSGRDAIAARARDGAIPLAHQARARRRREPAVADARPVRVRHLHDVGHLPHAAAASRPAARRPRRRARGRPRADLRGGGQFPIGYRMAKGSDRFARQASGLAHTLLADACAAGAPGIDWDAALVNMLADLRRTYGEDFLTGGRTEPISHTLDIAFAYWCTARVADHVGDRRVSEECRRLAGRWRAAFDERTGILRDSTFYEGTAHNYSFRLTHDMAGRIALAGGDDAFVALLDAFFGFGADPVTQPGVDPSHDEMEAGYALGRFEGLNNEPDMEAPWAYMYAGRPDRTAEIVHAALRHMFGDAPPDRGRRPPVRRRIRPRRPRSRVGCDGRVFHSSHGVSLRVTWRSYAHPDTPTVRSHHAPSSRHRRPRGSRDLRPLGRSPQPRGGRARARLRRGAHRHVADRAPRAGGPAAQAARDRAAVQPWHHGRAAGARGRLQGRRRALHRRPRRAPRRAVHGRRADR